MTVRLTLDEFTARFVAEMLRRAGELFPDGSSIRDYAVDTAQTYYDDQHTEDPNETPEDCVAADMSYWEKE